MQRLGNDGAPARRASEILRFVLVASLIAGCATGVGPSGRGEGGVGQDDASFGIDGGMTSPDGPTLDGGADDDAGSDGDAGPEPDGGGCVAPRVSCGDRCVDLASDSEHCGACGNACALPGALATCISGACAISMCRDGWLDCNGSAGDGCEAPSACAEGSACTTRCGSTGTLSCADRCAPTCRPPAEICNLADDDCDGACERNLPGCRVAVHRSNGSNGHFYTTNRSEASCCGLSVEEYDYFYLYASPVGGTQPFVRCLASGGAHFYTTHTGCEGAGTSEGTMGYIATGATCGAVPLYRLRLADGRSFYTYSASERDDAQRMGFTYVGVVGYVWRSP